MNLEFIKPQNLGSLQWNQANQILIYDCQVGSYLITTVQLLTNSSAMKPNVEIWNKLLPKIGRGGGQLPTLYLRPWLVTLSQLCANNKQKKEVQLEMHLAKRLSKRTHNRKFSDMKFSAWSGNFLTSILPS